MVVFLHQLLLLAPVYILLNLPQLLFKGINLASSGASHPPPACRILNNRAKKCIYRTILTNQYNYIASAGNFNQLISSSIVHPTAILIVPYVSSAASFAFPDFATKSSFDTVPGDDHSLSLTNLQVTRSKCPSISSQL